jgi:hypothetical protein
MKEKSAWTALHVMYKDMPKTNKQKKKPNYAQRNAGITARGFNTRNF